MSNIKIGGSTYSGVDTIKVKNADDESQYISFNNLQPQEKSVTVTTNGITEVTPDSGKTLSKVTVTTDVPSTGDILIPSTIYVKWGFTTDMGSYPSSTTANISLYFVGTETDTLIESKTITIDWDNPVLFEFSNVPTSFASITKNYGYFYIKIEFNESWDQPASGNVVVINSVSSFNTKIPQNICSAINMNTSQNGSTPSYWASTYNFNCSVGSTATRYIYSIQSIESNKTMFGWNGNKCLLVYINSKYYFD